MLFRSVGAFLNGNAPFGVELGARVTEKIRDASAVRRVEPDRGIELDYRRIAQGSIPCRDFAAKRC